MSLQLFLLRTREAGNALEDSAVFAQRYKSLTLSNKLSP